MIGTFNRRTVCHVHQKMKNVDANALAVLCKKTDRQTDIAGGRSISPYCDLRVSDQQSHVMDKASLINREDSGKPLCNEAPCWTGLQ